MSLWPHFQNCRVLVTGDTGFKGGWICHWLRRLGADVAGLGLPPSTQPNLFQILQLDRRIRHYGVDVRDFSAVQSVVKEEQPEIVFHLAAQALVRESYAAPRDTFDTNVGGVVNVLEAIRLLDCVRACVVVTTDKCYENQEWIWGYRENDSLGGNDPYSASKAAAELAVAAYRRSFFGSAGSTRIATARAGNVIGGGDWSRDRIVVDLVESIRANRPLVLRNPGAIRPWQHVLDPISGYLQLASQLLVSQGEQYTGAWNFGPDRSGVTVLELSRSLVQEFGRGSIICRPDAEQPHEAHILNLDCAKAKSLLGWTPIWDLSAALRATAQWYAAWDRGVESMIDVTLDQIRRYESEYSARALSDGANSTPTMDQTRRLSAA